MKNEKRTPELLLPVGNIEAFNAALEGGCDAIYLGLKTFNARKRARNFSAEQLSVMCTIAHKKGVKVYVTLNVVIKNGEITELINLLYQISQTEVDAVIIQDWGVYNLIKRHFPRLDVHASTQMANHNSLGSHYSKERGFTRIVLARELTMPELTTISNKKATELELFVHGALCYSFSGMCFFSSFLGGAGANRGYCTQPCRRVFDDGKEEHHIFSLKDNEQIDNIPTLIELGVDSLKIEGRMKSADYVYQVARAYRLALDNPKEIPEAKELLRYDMGREKTSYFLGTDAATAITETPNTGIYLGAITSREGNTITFQSAETLNEGDRVRVVSKRDGEQQTDKLKEIYQDGRRFSFTTTLSNISKGDKIYLAGIRIKRFQNKLDTNILNDIKIRESLPANRMKQLTNIKTPRPPKHEEIYIRIGEMEWLRKIHFDFLDGLILSLTKSGWDSIDMSSPFIQKNRHKVWIEFPKFIPEKSIKYYRDLADRLFKSGFSQFMLSHLSQKLLLPKGAVFATNESVYAYNDAAISEIQSEGAQMHTYPIENDLENLEDGVDRSGIMPIYFKPALFSSRMPVEVADKSFRDDTERDYITSVRDGITHTVCETPVSFTQYHSKFKSMGFRRFLIDLSFEAVSKNLIKKIQTRFKHGEQIQPSANFNFKKGLK